MHCPVLINFYDEMLNCHDQIIVSQHTGPTSTKITQFTTETKTLLCITIISNVRYPMCEKGFSHSLTHRHVQSGVVLLETTVVN